jgi:hypothetical protein
MRTITPELHDVLADLVDAADQHSKATETFLRSPVGGDPEDEIARAKALERAHAAVADAGQEVARIARQMGIKPHTA